MQFDIIQRATNLLFDHHCCNRCLGRQFGNLLYGFSNSERGYIIKVNVLMEWEAKRRLKGSDYPIPSSFLTKDFTKGLETIKKYIKDIKFSDKECEICRGILTTENIEAKVKIALENLADLEYDTLLVGCKMPPEIVDREEDLRSRYDLEWGESIKSEFNRVVGKRLLELLGESKEVDFNAPDIVIIFDLMNDDVEVKINPLFIAGRYQKLKRGIPQSRWFCRVCHGVGCENCNGTGKMYEDSVEEYVTTPLISATNGITAKFHGSGREDIDARMLGSGRPFVVEISEPKIRRIDLKKLEEIINKNSDEAVKVTLEKFTDRNYVREIKSKSSRNAKAYRAIVELKNPTNITEEKIIEISNYFNGRVIHQRTPTRVSHRRADKVRLRKVHSFKITKIIDPKTIEVKVKCEGGLYVKELINGDNGRTQENLSELLGTEATVVELDVLEVFSSPQANENEDDKNTKK